MIKNNIIIYKDKKFCVLFTEGDYIYCKQIFDNNKSKRVTKINKKFIEMKK